MKFRRKGPRHDPGFSDQGDNVAASIGSGSNPGRGGRGRGHRGRGAGAQHSINAAAGANRKDVIARAARDRMKRYGKR